MTKQQPPQLAVSPAEAAAMLGLSKATFYRQLYPQVLAGQIKSLKVGRCRRILVASLNEWIERNQE